MNERQKSILVECLELLTNCKTEFKIQSTLANTRDEHNALINFFNEEISKVEDKLHSILTI